MNTMPTLRGRPIVGSLPEFRKNRLGLLLRAYREGGELVRVPILIRDLVVITGPELAHQVLVKQADKFRKSQALARYSRPMLGNGLLTSEGETHRRQRRRIAPGLSSRQVARYADIMVRHTDDFLARARGQDIMALDREMTRLTLGIAAESMFGSAPVEHARAVSEAIAATTRYISEEVGRPLHVPLSWPTPRNRALLRSVGTLDGIVRGMIQERRQERRRQDDAGQDDILGMLLAAQDQDDGSRMTDEEVRDEVMTLFVAGHDTLANTLCFALMLLARHPEIADQLAEESHGVLGGRAPTVDDLPRLPLALGVFKETMRLYPAAYLVGRETLEPVALGGHTVPPGITVFVNLYGLHRRPDLFPEPERFDPERFTEAAEKARPRNVYMPFSDGVRICIGNHFALLQGQLVLAHLGQHLAFSEVPGAVITPLPHIVLRAAGDARLAVRWRTRPE